MKYGNELATAGFLDDQRGRRDDAAVMFNRAVAAFGRAAALRPSFETWLAVGETAKKVGDLDTVLDAFEKALAHSGSSGLAPGRYRPDDKLLAFLEGL